MSFMFNPHPYNEPTAINRPKVKEETINALCVGIDKVAEKLCKDILESKGTIFSFDGYPAADFSALINLISGKLNFWGRKHTIIDMKNYYLSAEELEEKFKPNLPVDRQKDPVLLFGKRLEGGYAELVDSNLYVKLLSELKAAKQNAEKVLLFGFGTTYTEE